MNYEKYLRGLVVGAKKSLDALNDWKKDGEDDYFSNQMSHFIGYCLALEGLLEKEVEKAK